MPGFEAYRGWLGWESGDGAWGGAYPCRLVLESKADNVEP